MPFFDKYMSITQKQNTYVCVGLDSDFSKLPTCLKNEDNPLLVFNKKIIDETYKHTACYKPNMAFYLAQGSKGIETLKQTIDYVPEDIPVIIDLKAGDIGNTMEQYALSVFEYFQADAMTINVLMGSDVIKACLSVENSFCFALAYTSNPSAVDYFRHYELYKKILSELNKTDEKRIGAVVGATDIDNLLEMRNLFLESIFLIPGIGAQGGDLEAVCSYASYKRGDERILVNSSRAIIFADDTQNFAQTAGLETKKLKEKINKELKL